MELDLFAGMRVSDYEVAKGWYERLLGSEPAFVPHATEAVSELAEIEPDERETSSNGVRKAISRDADGHGVGCGGPPAQ